MIDHLDTELPEALDLPAKPRGVVLHWTAGGPRANAVDLKAYHFVVEKDGNVRRGFWPVVANMRKVSGGDYAMHTGGFNSYRVGISGAGMMSYESPREVGPYPLTQVQVERMCELAAYFCQLGDLDPLQVESVLTHREVWTKLGIKGTRNHLKLDIEHLPFALSIDKEDVGDHLRSRTAWYLNASIGAEIDSVLALMPPPDIDGDEPKTRLQRPLGLLELTADAG